MSNILNRRRSAALLGAAIIVGAASLPYAFETSPAVASPAAAALSAGGNGSFADIVDADKPAVVTIVTTMKAADTGDSADNSEMQEQFKQFFEQQGIPMPRQAPQPQSGEHAQALGSGFIVSPDGYIVTNNHVIANATDIKVTLDDGTELPGKLIGADTKADLAVVKIEAPKPCRPLPGAIPASSSSATRSSPSAIPSASARRSRPASSRHVAGTCTAALRRFHPDRCADQPRQFGRPAG
jgi:serine protease Do